MQSKYAVINLSAPSLHTHLTRPLAKVEKAMELIREVEGVLIEDNPDLQEAFFVLDLKDPFAGMALFGYLKAINERSGAVDIETDAGQSEVDKLTAEGQHILKLIEITKGIAERTAENQAR